MATDRVEREGLARAIDKFDALFLGSKGAPEHYDADWRLVRAALAARSEPRPDSAVGESVAALVDVAVAPPGFDRPGLVESRKDRPSSEQSPTATAGARSEPPREPCERHRPIANLVQLRKDAEDAWLESYCSCRRCSKNAFDGEIDRCAEHDTMNRETWLARYVSARLGGAARSVPEEPDATLRFPKLPPVRDWTRGDYGAPLVSVTLTYEDATKRVLGHEAIDFGAGAAPDSQRPPREPAIQSWYCESCGWHGFGSATFYVCPNCKNNLEAQKGQ